MRVVMVLAAVLTGFCVLVTQMGTPGDVSPWRAAVEIDSGRHGFATQLPPDWTTKGAAASSAGGDARLTVAAATTVSFVREGAALSPDELIALRLVRDAVTYRCAGPNVLAPADCLADPSAILVTGFVGFEQTLAADAAPRRGVLRQAFLLETDERRATLWTVELQVADQTALERYAPAFELVLDSFEAN